MSVCFEEKVRGVKEGQGFGSFKIHLDAAQNHSFSRRGQGKSRDRIWWPHTHTHTRAHKCPSSPQSMQCISLFYMDNRWEQKWPGLSASPSYKETLGCTVPGHRGRGWLLCGEDVASSQVKSNFVSRKFHLHFLLPPSHLAPLRHADNSNTLACTGHLLTACWLTYICLLPPSWIAV